MPSVDQRPSTNALEPPSSFSSLKLNGSSSSTGSVDYPSFVSDPQTTQEYYERAQQVSDLLGLDVHIRDEANEVPYRQVQLLKDSGLVTALGKKEFGGGGQSPETGYHLVRIVARGDGSLGQLLAYHYLWSWTALTVGTEDQIEREQRRYIEKKLFYGAAVNPRDSDLAITESDDGQSITFNGKKAFSTGSKVSDLTVLEGVLPDGKTHVFVITESNQEGIKYGDDWKGVLGMRGTQSGSIEIKNVTVPWSAALGFNEKKEFVALGAFNTLLLPASGHGSKALDRGAIAKAANYTVANTRAWPFAGDVKSKGYEEIYGTLQAKLWAVEAQVDVLARTVSGILNRSDRSSLTDEERGRVAVRIAGAKVTATEVSLEVTSRIYEVLGARSIGFKAGFDHFFRNVRTHTLHDPVAHKKAEVGRYVLNGELPTPTWYT
ncbi:hypothetical protein JCM11491_001771 [Sporobolomyces phaffii]